MVLAIQVLIPSCWVTSHLGRPPEVWFILNPLQDFMKKLFECHVDLLGPDIRLLNSHLPPRLEALRPWILCVLRNGRCLALTLLSIIFQPFILLYSPHKLMHALGGPYG